MTECSIFLWESHKWLWQKSYPHHQDHNCDHSYIFCYAGNSMVFVISHVLIQFKRSDKCVFDTWHALTLTDWSYWTPVYTAHIQTIIYNLHNKHNHLHQRAHLKGQFTLNTILTFTSKHIYVIYAAPNLLLIFFTSNVSCKWSYSSLFKLNMYTLN